MKRVSLAFFALAALVFSAYAATVPPLLPRGVAPSDRLPVINTGTTNAYTVSPDQLSSYVQGQISTASATRRGLVKGGGVGIAIRPDGTLDATGAAIAEGVIAFENVSTAIKGRYQWIGADAAGSAAAAVTGHESLYNHDNLPTAMQRSALLGSYGTPGSSNRYVTDLDPRNADARTPKTHAATHGAAGTDPVIISSSQVTGLDAALSGKQAALANAATLGKIGEIGGLPLWNGGAWPGGGGQAGGDMYKATYDPANHAADAFSRANHTGTQPANTVTGLAASATTDTTTTANISDSANKRFVTDAQRTVLASTSGTNTGDETQATIKTKLGAATDVVDGYLTAADHLKITNAQPAATAITTANIGAQTANLAQDATHRWATDAEKAAWNAKQNALTAGVDYLAPNGSAANLTGINASNVSTGTLDGNRLPAMSATKPGAVPATGTPSGKVLSDYGTWIPMTGGSSGDTLTLTTKLNTPLVESSAGNGDHMLFCANTGDMITTKDSVAAQIPNSIAWGTADFGRFCFNQGTGKFRYWTGTALADMITGGGTWGSITGTLSSQSDLNTALAAKANLASPALTGTPTAPTASGGTSSAQIATTAFVASAIASLGSGTIGGSTGSTADKVLTANGTGGSSAKASPTSIDPTTGAVTIPKQSGVPTLALFYNDSGTQTTGSGRIGPSGSMAKSYAFQDPNGIPGAGNVMVTGPAADQTTAAGTVAVIPTTAMALASGPYTPTYTAVTNAALTNVTARYMRIGNEVEVKGTVQDNVVGGSTSFDISLPVASDLALVSDCTGLALSTDGGASNPILGVVTCNTTSDRVNVTLTNAGASGGIYVRYNFTYTVK